MEGLQWRPLESAASSRVAACIEPPVLGRWKGMILLVV